MERDERLEALWRTPPGLASLSGVNHTTVGLRMVVTGFVFFLVGGVLSMLIRSQLSFAGNRLLDPEEYNAAFTLHGTAMMFFFAVPIMLGFATFLVPKMIGARDLVFPRLSAFGYWCYLFGGLLLFSSLLFGEPPTGGWFMYTPLTSEPYSPDRGPDFWLLGITFAEISALASSVELVVSILKTRAPGMSLERMPIFVWSILVTALMILLAFPPLILGGTLLEVERAFGLPFYDPARGGDALLWQHLFWLFGHPEVYIIFLPAAGIVSTIVPTFARRPLAGYTLVVLALLATGFLSFGLWVHHMYATAIPLASLGFFSAASMAVAIPSGIQVFSWIATLWNGRPVSSTPMLFVLGFLFIFVLGGLTGVMVALVPFDWQVHDTHFVVAHLHYVLFGGMVFPLFAGLYYWLPLVTGRRVSELTGRLVFWTIFLGFNLTFLPMHWTGLLGMPRRVYTYAEGLGWELLNLTSTIGGFLTAAGVSGFLVDIALQRRFSPKGPRNPWGAGTLEWSIPSPVPSYNFAVQPRVEGREPLWQEERGPGYLAGPATQREMLVTSAVRAEPEQVVILPGNTWLPLVAAGIVGAFFVAVLAKAYVLALLTACAATAAFFAWAWRSVSRGEPAVDAGQGLRLPLHFTQPRSPGWWGMAMALVADAALYASLLFAHLFLWTLAPSWPPEGHPVPELLAPGIALAALAASSVAFHLRHHAAAIVLALAAAVVESGALLVSGLTPSAHAYGAVVAMLWTFAALHIAIAVLMAAYVVLRRHAGHAERHAEPVVALFWHYVVGQWAAGFVVIHLLPQLLPT
ncbi:MAG TPA: cytochrome c oxidase subunit I [Burkholderiales bacterium]|nr:cytochrome c oxidase subunit I [Burkholderiales bacterium]